MPAACKVTLRHNGDHQLAAAQGVHNLLWLVLPAAFRRQSPCLGRAGDQGTIVWRSGLWAFRRTMQSTSSPVRQST